MCIFLTTNYTSIKLEKPKQNGEGCSPYVVAYGDLGASCSKLRTESFQGGVLLMVFRVIIGILAVKIRRAKASITQKVINEIRCQMYRQENGKHNFLWDQLM